MDNGHTLSAWPPHSYENIYFLQERYESVVMSSQMVDQTRFLPALHHKDEFVYQSSAPARANRSVGHEVKKKTQRS